MSFPPERIKRLRALYTSLAFRVGRKAGKPPNPDGPQVVLELLDEVEHLTKSEKALVRELDEWADGARTRGGAS